MSDNRPRWCPFAARRGDLWHLAVVPQELPRPVAPLVQRGRPLLRRQSGLAADGDEARLIRSRRARERTDHRQDAIDYSREYLRAVPTDPDRAAIETTIRELQARLRGG